MPTGGQLQTSRTRGKLGREDLGGSTQVSGKEVTSPPPPPLRTPTIAITSARKLLTNRSYGLSYHLCSG